MDSFRILGDVCHTISKCILIWAIHSNRSAEGISLITQALYALVFITRYTSIFRRIFSVWNFVLKIFYISSSLYILFLMLGVFARTREREKAWKLGGACLGASAIFAPLVMLIFDKKYWWGFQELLWAFSIILESVCILPQLLLLRQTTVPTVLDSFYLLTLGSYRAFYIINWIWRGVDTTGHPPDPISIIFGVVQTALYLDFGYVYWGRQRVKLRNRGVVDQDDFGRGWLLTRVLGKNGPRQLRHEDVDDEDDIEHGVGESGSGIGNGDLDGASGVKTTRKPKFKWGTRGISVSADQGVLDGQHGNGMGVQESSIVSGEGNDNAVMRDPSEMARILDEDEDEDVDGLLPTTDESNGAAWRDGSI